MCATFGKKHGEISDDFFEFPFFSPSDREPLKAKFWSGSSCSELMMSKGLWLDSENPGESSKNWSKTRSIWILKIPWNNKDSKFSLFWLTVRQMQVCNTHLLIGFWFCKCQILFKLVEVAARGFVVDLAQKTSYYFGLENITKTNIGFSWFAHLTHTVCRKLNLNNKWVTVLRV